MLFTSDYSVKMPLGQAVMTALVGIITVLLILAIIDVLIMVVSRVARVIDTKLGKNKEQSASSAQPSGGASPAPQGTPLPETQSQGSLTLIGTDEKTAAVIMALVSYQSGIPLNRLSFKSIKLLEDENK